MNKVHAVRKPWLPGNIQGTWARAVSKSHNSSGLYEEMCCCPESDPSKGGFEMPWAQPECSDLCFTIKLKTQLVILHRLQAQN